MRHIVTTVLLSTFMVWVLAIHDPAYGTVRPSTTGPGQTQFYIKSKCDKAAKSASAYHKKNGRTSFVKCVNVAFRSTG